MTQDGWSGGPRPPRAVPRLAETPAKGYSRPEVAKVAVALKVDAEEFSPSACDPSGACEILANIPSGDIFMAEGAMAVVDCGFSLEIPPGYRCSVSSLVPGLILEMVESQRFKVNAINLGGKTTLRDRDVIGKIWIEPVHFFEWVTKG